MRSLFAAGLSLATILLAACSTERMEITFDADDPATGRANPVPPPNPPNDTITLFDNAPVTARVAANPRGGNWVRLHSDQSFDNRPRAGLPSDLFATSDEMRSPMLPKSGYAAFELDGDGTVDLELSSTSVLIGGVRFDGGAVYGIDRSGLGARYYRIGAYRVGTQVTLSYSIDPVHRLFYVNVSNGGGSASYGFPAPAAGYPLTPVQFTATLVRSVGPPTSAFIDSLFMYERNPGS
jgi:hypothetical protein